MATRAFRRPRWRFAAGRFHRRAVVIVAAEIG
jgi:hypothetical protein